MKVCAETESRLIGNIYDAALDPGLWPKVLEQIVAVGECNSGVITAIDTLNADYTLFYSHNIPALALQRYRDEGMDLLEMEVHGRHMIEKGAGVPILSETMFGSQEEYVRRAGVFYERIQKAANIHYIAGTLLDHGDFRYAALGIHRPVDWAPLTQQHAEFAQRMGQHIRRALQIHRQMAAVRHQNAQLYRMLDGLAVGAMLIDAKSAVRYANPRAESLLRHHGALKYCPTNGLRAAQSKQQQALNELLQGAIRIGRREQSVSAGGVIGLQRAQGETPLMLTIAPLSRLAGYGELASDDIAAAVFLTDLDRNHTLSRKLLQQSYGLSERERDLCEAFVNSGSLEATAIRCGVTLETARTYLKAVFQKTGQHSQAELMRLLMGLTLDFEHIR